MKTVKRIFALLMMNILSLPYILLAQDGGTYIDNLDVQDSSYMEQDLLTGAEQSGSNIAIYIIVAVVVVVVVAFLFIRKKKK